MLYVICYATIVLSVVSAFPAFYSFSQFGLLVVNILTQSTSLRKLSIVLGKIKQ